MQRKTETEIIVMTGEIHHGGGTSSTSQAPGQSLLQLQSSQGRGGDGDGGGGKLSTRGSVP